MRLAMPALIVLIGAVLAGGGIVLLLNLGGAADALIRRVTSRNLGSLAPGYAADPNGMRVYAALLVGLGLAVLGVGVGPGSPLVGALAFVAGAVVFVAASVLIIAGEVRTYRALPKPPER
jgi:hypothetical protein